MASKRAPLTHMTSTLINWKAIRQVLNPILDYLAIDYNIQQEKTGKTAREIILGTIILNFDNCKNAEDVMKVIVTFYNYDVPETLKFRIIESVKDDMEKNNGIFNVKRWIASLIILRPMPLEEKMQVLFLIMDANGDGHLDADELFFGIKQFFIGIIKVIQNAVDKNLFAKMGFKGINLDETRETAKQLSEVYTEDKVRSIVAKCIANASKNKTDISYQEWIDWFPLGAPEAFGSAKILFDPTAI